MEITAVIDPVTRIEGHLKISVDVDTVNGVQQVVQARATGSLFRGFENILVGRDPRDGQHITERICGVCPVAHGMAAVLALDSAFGITVPSNARIMRNLVSASNFIDSHILHFYLLALPDFLDGPAKPPWQPTWRVDKRFSGEQTEHLLGHYLKAIEMRRKAHEMGAVFGGRLPHPPAYIPGGFTANPRSERIAMFKNYLAELIPFITDVYLPDVEALAIRYPEYFSIGVGTGNLLSFGVFNLNAAGDQKLLQRGHIPEGGTVQPVDQAEITEHVTYSWYDDATNGLTPAAGETMPQKPKGDAYSWLKAPRYNGKSYEVGPLARMMVSGDYTNGISVMDRHRSRAFEALKIIEAMQGWVDSLVPDGDVYVENTIPQTAEAHGLTEAPRGALGHWVKIENQKISRYQVITPTTWNSSPRDSAGAPGALEQALLGAPVENASEPIEVMRIIHAFDPCLDCAVHVIRPKADAKIFSISHTHGEDDGHVHHHAATDGQEHS
jgi:hydrogenase large subunit